VLADCDLVAFVATTDLARAREFYEGLLGLTFIAETPIACLFDAHGTTVRVTAVPEVHVAPYTVLGWTVPDIASVVRSLVNRGVGFQRFDGMAQDDLGVWRTPSGDQVAWFTDPDGNTLSVTQLTGRADQE
jgi:catechol 2,3-dioxygenase-like lactoylglutathione lyase family enzyme